VHDLTITIHYDTDDLGNVSAVNTIFNDDQYSKSNNNNTSTAVSNINNDTDDANDANDINDINDVDTKLFLYKC